MYWMSDALAAKYATSINPKIQPTVIHQIGASNIFSYCSPLDHKHPIQKIFAVLCV